MTDEHEAAAASARRAAPHGFGVGRIALRQLRSRPALAVAQGITLAAAVTLLASVVLIQNTATDNGLRSALTQTGGIQASSLVVERDGISTAGDFDTFQREVSERVHSQLGNTVVAGAQLGKSPAQVLRSIDGAQQGQPFSELSSVSYYAGLRGHVRLVAGVWPGDGRTGTDWSLTASARATDTLGTPLDIHVGSEYCFSARLERGSLSPPWCGRVAATWLPTSASDPYWAGHVPETDVLTDHDSFFQVVDTFPRALNSAIQEYVPDAARISGANAHGVVQGVNQLRGYYSVASNDVFVSGLDTTVTAFLARQDAASGPMLVSAIGLLVVALAATAFAALQFINGHVAETALWRARGWPRLRVWRLHTAEFAVLSLAALPVAVAASAAISASVAGAATRSLLSTETLVDAAVPAAVASAAFLLVLSVLAATRSGPELSQRRPDRLATRRRSLGRRAVDLALAGSGAAILLLVRFAGADSTGTAQSSGLLLALAVLGVGLLAVPSVRLVGVAARVLSIRRTLGARLARFQVERDPAQFARLCLLVTLAVAVGVFASTYTASDRASAVDRADYMVGADLRATFSAAASPPQLTNLAASLPTGVHAAQVFRGIGRPGRTGTDATVLGIQGTDFWDIAYSRSDFATPSLRALTSTMAAADPDGLALPGTPHAVLMTVYSSGLDARIDVELTDATGRDVVVPMGTLGAAGWTELSASLPSAGQSLSYPVRVRALRVTPLGSNGAGDVAVENLRTDTGAVVESFGTAHGWWEEAFAPDIAETALKPALLHTRHGELAVDVAVDLQPVLLLPPPSSRPLPVLLAAPTMAALGVGVGQAFPLHMDTVDVQLIPVGSFDDFPTHYPQREDLVVAPRSSLLSRLGHEGATSPWPNELWLSVPSRAMAAVNGRLSIDSTLLSSTLRADAETTALNDPLRVGIHDELQLGFIVALAVVVVGFGLHFLAAARNRATHFAIMRANGVPQAALRGSLVAEQLVVLVSGLLAGTAIGLALSWAVIPIFHLGALPEDVTPSSVFHIDPLTLISAVLGTGAVALVMGRAVAGSGSRVDVMATVRSLA